MDLYQFKKGTISKKFLLTDGYDKLYGVDNLQVDNKLVFIMDVSEYNFPLGKTIVYHLELGAIIDPRTTRQLSNAFCDINQVGYALTKVLAGLFKLKCYLPYVHGYIAYMPLTGATRNNANWIALHLIKEAKQVGKKIELTTINGEKFEMDFPKGEFNQRVHDVALITQGSFLFMKAFVNAGMCELQPPEEIGLLAKYEDCNCPDHQEMRIKVTDLRYMFINIKAVFLMKLGIDIIERDDMIKYYGQNLSRFKRNY
ncbi:hypothetical protein [Companilactobacillus nantensis]|uniref:Uncharacterized protein n=1 Tax=Companilactobacillus nantensis DSM 16982 TaxID=1423774 RepID=A0A0R1WML7_9LACO|nr:hypothetical protein [Companilactobacillus nantensis]KRM15484.1 hypothetical protein FD31_GL001199 [Companilactobacillus nantensis DSM 16982]GEO64915.1 hypothetical protein LNA01_20980 [Companilactobacillus nantensis]